MCLSAVIPAKASDAVKLGLLCLRFSFLFIFVIQKGKKKKENNNKMYPDEIPYPKSPFHSLQVLSLEV